MNREELIVAAADELNVSSVGQSLAPEDYEKIDEKIDGLLASLSARGIIHLPNADTVPDAVSEQLAILLAEACCKAFGRPRDYAVKDRVEEEIRVIVKRKPATNKYLETDMPVMGETYTYSRWLLGE